MMYLHLELVYLAAIRHKVTNHASNGLGGFCDDVITLRIGVTGCDP